MGDRKLQIWLNQNAQHEQPHNTMRERKYTPTMEIERTAWKPKTAAGLFPRSRAIKKLFAILLVFACVLICYLVLTSNTTIPSDRMCLPDLEQRYGVCVACQNLSATSSGNQMLIVNLQGRLGNQLFQYAALIGIARQTRKLPVLRNTATELLNLFPKLSACVFKSTFLANAATHFFVSTCTDLDHCKFSQANIDCVASSSHVQVDGYLQSARYFASVRQELAQEFAFSTQVKQRAEQQLSAIRNAAGRPLSFAKNGTSYRDSRIPMVGVHVRRGDIVRNPHFVHYGYLPATSEYVSRAANYFAKRYPNAHFVICSDDYSWTHSVWPERLLSKTHYCDSNNRPEEDLALLASCDHSIITVGSFSFWTAYLRETMQMYPMPKSTRMGDRRPLKKYSKPVVGETIYYAKPYRDDTELAKLFNIADYYPQEWIALE